ncbi:MAG: hypothetical protein IT438_07985 [Phycisphaerales bacterium]|nr:hypothetical protein [Phycisphaerales bacterium]
MPVVHVSAQPEIVRASEPEPTEPAPDPAPLPDLAPAVSRLLGAPYLTEDEKRDLRIFHGVWTEADLDSPARAAAAALARGDFLDPSFGFEGVDPRVRIQALIGRGDYPAADAALKALPLPDVPPIIDFRLRADVLEAQGKFDAAAAMGDGGLAALAQLKPASPADVVEAVRLLNQRIRLKGTGDRDGKVAGPLRVDPNAFHQMLEQLGRLREQVDAAGAGSPKLYWPSLLAEARLLQERDKADDAAAALAQTLALNPTCVEAWALLGRMAADSFNFGQAEKIAQRLDIIAANPAPGAAALPDAEADQPASPRGASIEAAIIRARVAMRQIDGAGAVATLDPLLERYPTHPRLLAMRAAADAARFEFGPLKERLAAFDRLYPGSPLALFDAGRSLAESRQYEQSAEMLLEAHRRLPAAPEIPAELGLMYVQFGLIEEARDYLDKAHALDPFDLRVDNSLRLVRELLTYSELRSDHFVVRYKPTSPGDGAFARDIITGMEANHKIVTGNGPGGIDHQPFGGHGRTTIDLMPDHEWFGVRIAGMPAIHTIAASTGPVIAMEAPRVGPKHQGNYDWLRVLRHEYTHTVNLDRTLNRIPHWFTEAGAVYLELAPRDFSTCELLRDASEAGALFDLDEINIAFVRPRRPSDRSQGYAQGHWMYEYIIERWGNKAPLDMMDLYAQGAREEQAFQTVLGVTRGQFLAQFKEWSVGRLRAWGMIPPEGMPPLKELFARLVARTDTNEAESPKPEGEPAADEERLTPEVVAGWLELYPTHPDVLELAVDQAVKKAGGRATPGMVPLLDRYAAARPVDPKPHRLLAQMYLASPDPAEQLKAIDHLEFLDAREQKLTGYATELAKRYFARNGEGDVARAQVKAERATQIAPYEAPPRELAATIAIRNGDFAAARRHIEALIELEPDRDIHKQRLEALKKLEAR